MAIKVLIFGIDNAGKTALNTMMRVGTPPKVTRPTLSFDINSMIVKDLRFELWDAPGQVNLRKKWERGLLGSQILFFVLDVADKQRFEESKKELDKVLNNPDVADAPLIVCYHKMDWMSLKRT
jgi:small GTP-binding protein